MNEEQLRSIFGPATDGSTASDNIELRPWANVAIWEFVDEPPVFAKESVHLISDVEAPESE